MGFSPRTSASPTSPQAASPSPQAGKQLPWAPHGFARLVEAYNAGDPAAIATALASMRPGNLAEPEDLRPLLAMIASAEAEPKAAEAVAYARMVVNYVNDGSGTPDMIEKAVSRLLPYTQTPTTE